MTDRYPPVAVGCCFYGREQNYQRIVESLEGMARAYKGTVEAYVYLSGLNEDEMCETVHRLRFTNPAMFVFKCGPNRIDEPKYRLPLESTSDFIFTTDDDCLFAPETLIVLMDTYCNLVSLYGCTLSPVGWFGTDFRGTQLQLPIEGRFSLKIGEWRQVDYLGSCGCLYRRELLSADDFAFEYWPAHLRHVSDLWLSYLMAVRFKTPAFVTSLEKADLPEWGYSLWEQHNRHRFCDHVGGLVAAGWERTMRLKPVVGRTTKEEASNVNSGSCTDG